MSEKEHPYQISEKAFYFIYGTLAGILLSALMGYIVFSTF